MASQLDIILRAIDKASGPVNGVTGSLGRLGDSSNGVLRSLGPVTSLIGTGIKVAAGVGVGALVGFGLALVDSVNKAADMEQGIADIAAVMGLAKSEIGPLSTLIQNLGLDPKLKVNATEAADAIEMLAKNGLSMSEIIGGAARQTVLLSNATGGDFATAANIATDVMALFGIKAENMQRAVNGITGVTIASKFGVDDYRLALAQAGGVAATVGVGFEDFNTVIAAISPSFASGSDAGTSFKTVLQRLIPQSQDAEEAMKQLGLMTEDGKNKFFDASGQMRSMGEISGLLNVALGGLSDEQKNQALSTIFGTDAMRAAAAMANFSEVQFDDLKATIGKTDAEEQAKTRMDTLRGSLEILTGVFDSIKLMIGEKFLPVFKKLVDKVSEYLSSAAPGINNWAQTFADKLGQLIDRYLPIFLENVDRFIANLPTLLEQIRGVAIQTGEFLIKVMAVLGPIAAWILQANNLKIIMYALAGVMIVNALASIVAFVAGVWSAVPAIGAFMAALSPVTIIVAAIAAAIYLLYLAWQNNFLGIRDITAAVWAKLQEWFGNIVNWFRNFPEHLTSFGNALWDKARWVISRLSEGISGARDLVSNAWNGVKDWLNRAKDEWLPGFGQSLFDFGRNALNRMGEGFNNIRDSVKGVFQSALDWVAQGKEGKLGPLQQALYDGGRQAIQRLGDGISSLRDFAKGQIEQVMNDAKERGWAYATGAFAGRMYDAARAAILRFGAGLAESNLSGDMQRVFDGLITTFNNFVNGFKNHVYGPARDVIQRVLDGFNDMDIGGKFNENIYRLVDVFNNFTGDVSNHFFESMKNVGGRLVDGLADGIRDAWSRLQDALNWIASIAPQWIKDALGIHSPSKIFVDIGQNLMQAMAQGVQMTAQLPQQALQGAAQGLITTGQQAMQQVANTTTNQFAVNFPNMGAVENPSQEAVRTMNLLTGVYA